MKTAEIKFIDLCDEIDYWKEKCLKAEAEVEYWRGQYSQYLHESLEGAQKGVASALMLALSARDDENGNLIIDRASRKELAKTYKP